MTGEVTFAPSKTTGWTIAMPPWFLLGLGSVVSRVLATSTGLHPLCGLLDFMLLDARLSKL